MWYLFEYIKEERSCIFRKWKIDRPGVILCDTERPNLFTFHLNKWITFEYEARKIVLIYEQLILRGALGNVTIFKKEFPLLERKQ